MRSDPSRRKAFIKLLPNHAIPLTIGSCGRFPAEKPEGIRHNLARQVIDDEHQAAAPVGIEAIFRPCGQADRRIAHMLDTLNNARQRITHHIDDTFGP